LFVVSGIQYLEAGIHSKESRIQDCLEMGWTGSSKNGSQDWFRKQYIALTQTKLKKNPNSETIQLRANENLSN